jgi:hypothetical protein
VISDTGHPEIRMVGDLREIGGEREGMRTGALPGLVQTEMGMV